jgi:hypothetical protein
MSSVGERVGEREGKNKNIKNRRVTSASRIDGFLHIEEAKKRYLGLAAAFPVPALVFLMIDDLENDLCISRICALAQSAG